MRYEYAGMRGRNLLTKRGSNAKMAISLLIDSNGLFWRFERVGTCRLFWQWLIPFIDLTLAEYRLELGRHLTTDELLTLVGPLKSPSGFPTAGHLKGFLRKRLGKVFDDVMFRDFWREHCFELKPPDSWGEVLELK